MHMSSTMQTDCTKAIAVDPLLTFHRVLKVPLRLTVGPKDLMLLSDFRWIRLLQLNAYKCLYIAVLIIYICLFKLFVNSLKGEYGLLGGRVWLG